MKQPTPQRRKSIAQLLREADADTAAPPPGPTPTAVPLETPAPGAATQPQNISLDQKVDRYLVQYERDATPMGQKWAGENSPIPIAERVLKSKRSMLSFLFEADEEAPLTPGADEPPPDAGGGGDEPPPPGEDDAGGGDNAAEGLPPTTPQLNINVFAGEVARLVSNYDALIDPRTTILNRVQAYVAKNYNDKVAKELMAVLDLQFDLTPRTENQREGDYAGSPIAANALGDIGAGSGGGGA